MIACFPSHNYRYQLYVNEMNYQKLMEYELDMFEIPVLSESFQQAETITIYLYFFAHIS